MVQRNFSSIAKLAFAPVIITVAILLAYWLQIEGIIDTHTFAIFPRKDSHLLGIISSPFVHGDIEHLIGNISVLFPLLILLFYTHKNFSFQVLVTLWICTGFLVWLFARDSYHIGASGVLYATQVFLLVSGMLKRRPWLMAIGAVSIMLFGGGFLFGLLPLQPHVSWESHALGALTGLVFAWIYREKGPTPRKIFKTQWVDQYQQFDYRNKK